MELKRFMGSRIEDQQAVNEEFVRLYRKTPAKNSLMLSNRLTNAVIFDGKYWNEFDYRGLRMSLTKKVLHIVSYTY